MVKFILRDMGFRVATSEENMEKIIKIIKDENSIQNEVLLDLSGCVFSYPLSHILKSIVDKMSTVSGSKKITIKHSYSMINADQITHYLNKKAWDAPPASNKLGDFIDYIADTYDITLKVVGDANA